MSAPMPEPDDITVEDRIQSAVGDADHFLRHVTPQDTTFLGRHDRNVETTTEMGIVVHNVVESYSDDAHGESIAWTRSLPDGGCPFCTGALDTDEDAEDGTLYETAKCLTCPYIERRASVDAPLNDPDYLRPLFYRAVIPHDFDDEACVDWEEMREEMSDDTDLDDVANIVRALSIRSYIGRIRDKAYDSDESELQTVECGHCGEEVDEPAAETHAHFGTVCPDCTDVTVWSVDDADLPDDVVEQMDEHASFTPDKVRSLLRDVMYYAAYKRTVLDDDDRVEQVSDGITTGRGGKRDAHGMGRGQKGTGLRRPNGAFHGDAHWRTVLQDAVGAGLIERVDDADCEDTAKDARWVATDKGRSVFDELARCETCGERKEPYLFMRVYQAQGKYTNKSQRLTLACSACDQMKSTPQGMTVASSSGRSTHKPLDGVEYDS